GGFACAVRPGEAGDVPRMDGKGHAVEGSGRPVPLAQPGDDNPWGAHRGEHPGSVWSHAGSCTWRLVPARYQPLRPGWNLRPGIVEHMTRRTGGPPRRPPRTTGDDPQ